MSQGRIIWVLGAALILLMGSIAAFFWLGNVTQPPGFIDPKQSLGNQLEITRREQQ